MGPPGVAKSGLLGIGTLGKNYRFLAYKYRGPTVGPRGQWGCSRVRGPFDLVDWAPGPLGAMALQVLWGLLWAQRHLGALSLLEGPWQMTTMDRSDL